MSHDRQVGLNATHRKPLPRPRLSRAAQQPSLPASPCHTKEKRWRTSANSCQSCHALSRRLSLDKRLAEIPAETCRPAPPPLLWHHYLLILYADLFHITVFSWLPVLFQTFPRARDGSLVTPKCLKIQLKGFDPDSSADHNVTPAVPGGVHTWSHHLNLPPPPNIHSCFCMQMIRKRKKKSLIKSELWDLLSATKGPLQVCFWYTGKGRFVRSLHEVWMACLMI